jgi:hypothetical protein
MYCFYQFFKFLFNLLSKKGVEEVNIVSTEIPKEDANVPTSSENTVLLSIPTSNTNSSFSSDNLYEHRLIDIKGCNDDDLKKICNISDYDEPFSNLNDGPHCFFISEKFQYSSYRRGTRVKFGELKGRVILNRMPAFSHFELSFTISYGKDQQNKISEPITFTYTHAPNDPNDPKDLKLLAKCMRTDYRNFYGDPEIIDKNTGNKVPLDKRIMEFMLDKYEPDETDKYMISSIRQGTLSDKSHFESITKFFNLTFDYEG